MAKNVIFDLDGTLLDTIGDIKDAINDALKAANFPYRYDKDGCRFLIGDGADNLVHRALKEMDNPTNFEKLKKEYMPRYKEYQNRHTKPFDGVLESLKYLKNHNISLFICTNKPDAYAQIIISKFFDPSLFNAVRGLREGEEPKPNPAIVNYFVDSFRLDKKETLFVGDSITDLYTAKNSGLPLALCLWGYGFYNEALLKEAKMVLAKPLDLEKIIL